MSKKAGRHSQQANDFLEPKPVENLTATNVGTNRAYNNGAANLSWNLPAGSPEATLYTIITTPTSTTETTTSTSFTFTGLPSNTAYTFSVSGSNAAGSSAATTSSSITITTVPQGPQSVTASSPNPNEDIVSWNAGSSGGSSITSFTVVSSDGPSYTNAISPLTISETGGTSQTYTVYAINSNGSSLGSASNSITTTSPFFPPFFPPYFPYFPFFPPFFPPYFPYFPFFPPFFPPYFPFFPPFFPPYFPYFPFFPPFFPPYFPFFPPYFPFFGCIDQDTKIAIVGENDSVLYKSVSEIQIGDVVWSYDWNGLDPEIEADPLLWNSDHIDSFEFVKTVVKSIKPSEKSVTVYFNGDISKRFSLEHSILIKRNKINMFTSSGAIEIGDSIFEHTGSGVVEVVVSSIDMIDEERTVYMLDASPYDIVIAGNIITHNAKGFF